MSEPGEVITPKPEGESSAASAAEPTPPVSNELPEVSPEEPAITPLATDEAPSFYRPEQSAAVDEADQAMVSWSASEFVDHSKTPAWFAGLGFVLAVVAIAAYVATRDFVSPIMLLLLGGAFGVFANRTPRVLDYGLNHHGIKIAHKFYAYDMFKSFSVVEEGPLHAVILSPLQRFMPSITVYYEPADEDSILEVLSNYLPFIEAQRDSVASLMRRVRF